MPTPIPQLEGHFHVELLDAKTQEVKQELKFKNLIVNAGLDGIGAGNNLQNMYVWLGVGTGAVAPTNADVQLGAQIGTRVNNNGGFADTFGYGAANAYSFQKRTRLLLEAEGNGNLSELGLFGLQVGAPMWTRQLFKDINGVTTVITKTSADQLRITYELRINIPGDLAGTVTIDSVLYNTVTRPANVGSFWSNDQFGDFRGLSPASMVVHNGAIGVSTGAPGGAEAATNTSATASAYVNGNYFRDVTHVFDPAIGNLTGGVRSASYWTTGNSALARTFQTDFGVGIPKINTKRLTLVVRHAWGRV